MKSYFLFVAFDLAIQQAKTPYQRLMEHLAEGRRKERLKAFHESLDPIALTMRVRQCRDAILLLLQRRREIDSE